MGTGSFPREKRLGCGVDHPPPPTSEVKEKSRAIPLLPLWAFVACSRVNFAFYLYLLCQEVIWRSVGIAPPIIIGEARATPKLLHIINIDITWRGVVSFTPLQHYPRRRISHYSKNSRKVGPGAGVEALEKRYKSCPSCERSTNLRTSILIQVAIQTTHCAFQGFGASACSYSHTQTNNSSCVCSAKHSVPLWINKRVCRIVNVANSKKTPQPHNNFA